MKHALIITLTIALTLSGCASVPTSGPHLDALFTTQPDLSATDIMTRAHEAAGGETWTRPMSLAMDGYAVFYQDGISARNEHHRMWRVYEQGKTNAHTVDGKVRIESIRGGVPLINLAFDGQNTYTNDGKQPQSAADKQWSSAFGFGVIRHALDAGYTLERLPDELIDGRPAYMVKVIAPSGGDTLFGIAIDDYAVLKVAFDTNRGWHERIYSNFYSNPGEDWVQPARVRLIYDGVKGNEVIWTSYRINEDLPDCLFVLPETDTCR